MDAPLTLPPNMTLNPKANPIARSPTAYAILFLVLCNVVNITYTAVNVMTVSNINALTALLSAGTRQPYPSMSVSKSLSLSGLVYRMKNCLKSLCLQAVPWHQHW